MWMAVAIITTLPVLLGSMPPDADTALADKIEKHNYTPYVPPRSNHGPGWVFEIAKTIDGKTVQRGVCDRLFLEPPTVDGSLTFSKGEISGTSGFEFGLGLLSDLLKDFKKASLNLSSKSSVVLKIEFGRTKSVEIPRDHFFQENGKAVPVTPGCDSALKMVRRANPNQNSSIFFVQDALIAESLLVTVDESRSLGLDADFELDKVFEFKPGVKWTRTGKTSIEILEPRYIGYRAFILEEFVPDPTMGPESAKIFTRAVRPQTLKELLSK